MTVNYPMVVDFARPSKTNTVVVRKGDSLSRKLTFILMSNGEEFDMSSITAVTIKAVDIKGNIIYDDATGGIQTETHMNDAGDLVTTNINKVDYTLPAALTGTAGRSTLSIQLMGSSEEVIESFDIYIESQNQLYNEDDYASETDISGFKDLLNRSLATLAEAKKLSERNSMPNPYPLTIMMGADSYTYDGSQQVSIIFEDGNTTGY